MTSISVKVWGAGGGGGAGGSAAAGGAGGAGGYATGTIAVTPGETLNVYVGGGGSAGTRNTSGGGGGGGAYSSIYRGSTPLAIAAGGGGGGGGRSTSTHIGGAGGAGGGVSGVAGSASLANNGGGGGTSSTGGAAGTGTNTGLAGSSLTGGKGADGTTGSTDGSGASGGLTGGGAGGGVISTNRAGGAGGGSGYFGGGGGAGSGTGAGGAGGGGGSSYGAGLTLTTGSGVSPANSSDPDRSGAGQGGSAGATANTGSGGSNGIIIIGYGAGGTNPSTTVNWIHLSTTDGSLESPNPGNGACSGWCTNAAYALPQARTNYSIVAYNGFLYVVGGNNSAGIPQNTVYIAKLGANGEPQLWHPTDTNKANWAYWYSDTALTTARSDLTAVAYNNRMYLLGGRSSTGPVNTAQIADITPTGQLSAWSSSTSLPYNLYGHSAQVYNDRLYILGGASTVGGAPLNSVYYNKINSNGTLNSWMQTNSFAAGRMAGVVISLWCGVLTSTYLAGVAPSMQVATARMCGLIRRWQVSIPTVVSTPGMPLVTSRASVLGMDSLPGAM